MTDEVAEHILATALHDFYPVENKIIEDWDLDQLDELGVWAATLDGCEVTDSQDMYSLGPEHGQNEDHEMEA